MNSQISPSVLVSVGLSFVNEYDEHTSDDKLAILERALTEFLDNRHSVFETAQIFQTVIGSTKPLDRIATILQTPDVPIPNFSMFANGAGNSRKKTRSWTEYEDQRLLAGIHRFGTDNWLCVANFVGNGRTRAQCSQRWIRGLDPRICKDKWSKEDEDTLMRLVDKYGTKSWTRIAQEMGNRSDVQCRYHYKQMRTENSEEQENVPMKISSSGSVPSRLNLNPPPIPRGDQHQRNRIELPSISDLLSISPNNLLNNNDANQQQAAVNQAYRSSGSLSSFPPLPRPGMSANTSLPTFPSFQAILNSANQQSDS